MDESWIKTFGFVRVPTWVKSGTERSFTIGPTQYTTESHNSFPEVVIEYAATLFDKRWLSNNGSASDTPHPFAVWYEELIALKNASAERAQGPHEYVVDGRRFAALALAYDLFILADCGKLSKSLLKRLRLPRAFQGARAETIAAATMARAGFVLEMEDESDNRTTHPEFVALDPFTNSSLAVEVKSIERLDVLGSPQGKPVPSAGDVNAQDVAKQVRSQLINALKKNLKKPFLVFVDLNLPLDVHSAVKHEILEEVKRVRYNVDSGWTADGVLDKYLLNSVVVMNNGGFYDEAAKPDRIARHNTLTAPQSRCLYPVPHLAIERMERAVQQHGTIPQSFELECSPDARFRLGA